MLRIYFLLIALWLGASCYSQASINHPRDSIVQIEVAQYEIPDEFDLMNIVLYLDYAKANIKNPEVFSLITADWVYQIDLVFTRYPYVFEEWRTDYDWLLQKRLENLKALDSTLFIRKNIQWNYILQTDCKTEEEAISFFHGFVIRMQVPETTDTLEETVAAIPLASKEPKPKIVSPPQPSKKLNQLAKKDPNVNMLKRVVFEWEEPLRDSSVYQVFERHPEWHQKLVVMDWTSSMYRNGASVLRWQSQQMDEKAMKHLVLFNDGDYKPHAHKKIGKTGGIYYVSPNNMDEVVRTMIKVKRRGIGGDAPENDLEALLKATRGLRDYEEVILIPDRNSSIRDIKLIKYLRKPVRIVVFKNRKQSVAWSRSKKKGENEWIHPHYLTLASITGGSLHTHNRDIYHLSELQTGQKIKIGWYVYQKLENGAFKVIDR